MDVDQGATAIPPQRAASQPPPRRPGGLGTRLAYGFGTIAFGIKDSGFNTFLLLFYNQVLGVRADLVGLAIMIALFVDGLIDPLIGSLSDRTRSPWGRRHPWMYAAILPCGVTFYLLWNPAVGLSHEALFAYLLALSVLVRISVALYEIPSASLAADLTTDYDQRTSLVAYRFFFAWVGGIAMSILAFSLFLRAQPGGGLFGRLGYEHYAVAAAVLMMIAMLASSLGTHRHIRTFRAPPAKRAKNWSRDFAEMRDALANRSFLAVLGAGLLNAMVLGMSNSLNVYFATYFWGLKGDQISLLVLCSLLAATFALVLAPLVSRRMEKKTAAVALALIGLILVPAPIALRLVGWFPANGSPPLLPLLFVVTTVATTLQVMGGIIGTSMTIDAIEDNELKTGQRTEGLYFAAAFFTQKFTSGFGIFAAGLVLSVVHFPAHAVPGQVDPAILQRLALVYLPPVMGFYLLSILSLATYRISREGHARNIAELSLRATVQARK